MSILSMRLKPAHPSEVRGQSAGALANPGISPSEHLIAASAIRPDDRVLVFGYNVLDHVVALARRGVDQAMGVYAAQPYRPREAVDVVWFTRVAHIDSEVTALLGGIGAPRLIAIELLDHTQFAPMRRLIARLRAKGMVNTSYYKAAGRFILTAWRAAAPRAATPASRTAAAQFAPARQASAPYRCPPSR